MQLIVGAGCVSKVNRAIPHRVKKEQNFLGNDYGAPSLSLNPNVKNLSLNLQNLFDKKPLRNRNNIVLWHDVINNSITPHKSKNNHPLTIKQLLEVLKTYQQKLSAIVYNQRFGTPDLFETLCQHKLTTIISVKRHLNTPRKKKSEYYRQELLELHPETQIEQNINKTIKRNPKEPITKNSIW